MDGNAGAASDAVSEMATVLGAKDDRDFYCKWSARHRVGLVRSLAMKAKKEV